ILYSNEKELVGRKFTAIDMSPPAMKNWEESERAFQRRSQFMLIPARDLSINLPRLQSFYKQRKGRLLVSKTSAPLMLGVSPRLSPDMATPKT
ncbi:hypothetical protein ACC687_38095, partial [Rhizobium ruizarguesonis]